MFGFMKRINKNTKRMIFFLFLFCLVFVLWGIALYYENYIEEHYASISIRLKSEPMSGRMLMQADKIGRQEDTGNQMGITAWNSLKSMELQSKELGTSANVNLIEVFGDMEKVYPIELRDGNVVSMDDFEGCLIDEATAYKLFHTVNAVDNLVSYQNQRYGIRGIIKSSEAVMLIGGNEENKTYSNLELTFTEQENAGQLAEEFLRKYGQNGQYVVIDSHLFAKGLSLMVRLPAWLLGFFFIYDLLHILYKQRRYPFQAVVLFLLLVIVSAVLFWMMEFELFIPDQLIPTKWSDFTFWSNKIHELKNWRNDYTYIMPHYKDVLFKQYVGLCVGFTATATIGMAALIIHERILYLGNERAGYFALVALLEGGAVYLLFISGVIFRLPRAYLGMPIFYMLARDCYQWCRQNLPVLLSAQQGKQGRNTPLG